nr:putative uncharacterized protein C6orf183 [Symphalangus syndactylus]
MWSTLLFLTQGPTPLPGDPTACASLYQSPCSVQMPNDIYYFRRERELALKKTLQVAKSKPLVIQADVMQRELESCLGREYTPENLPLLLLQDNTTLTRTVPALKKLLAVARDQSPALPIVQCQKTVALYIVSDFLVVYDRRKQVGYIMQEYNDSFQRAERLSVARENFLMGKNNPPNLVTQEDLTIYTKWLVCHLHSLGTVHQYLQALQYLPISKVLSVAFKQVAEVGQKNENVCVNGIDPDIQGSASPDPVDTSISGPMRTEAAFVLPQHATETGELKPQLKLLLSHFNIPYDVEELWDSAKEMELFSLIKPKCDPWQKKLLTKLKERRRTDALLQLQAKFLKEPPYCFPQHLHRFTIPPTVYKRSNFATSSPTLVIL